MGSVTHTPVVGRLINDEDWEGAHVLDLDTTDIAGLDVTTIADLTSILDPTAGQVSYLAASGREGTFVFDASDLSAEVASDPRQGIYIAPDGDTTGASGAWVRKFSGLKDVMWFGAAGDGVADDYVALQAWLDTGGMLYLPEGKYRSSARLLVRKHCHIIGEKFGTAAYFGYASIRDIPNSRIVFDAGVDGVYFMNQAVIDDTNTIISNPELYFVQQGSAHSSISDIGLLSLGGSAATGFYARTPVRATNIHVYNFAGVGFDLSSSADATSPGSEYGTTSYSVLQNCHAVQCGSHGFHLRGRDANVIKLDTCNAIMCTGWGYLDDGMLGNTYVNCHSATNTAGSFKTTGGSAGHVFIGCYVESGTGSTCDISYRCSVIGGALAGPARGDNTATLGYPNVLSPRTVTTEGFLELVTPQPFPGALTDRASVYRHANYGLVLSGLPDVGGSYDVTIVNKDEEIVAGVPTGTQNWNILGDINAPGSLSLGGSAGKEINLENENGYDIRLKYIDNDAYVDSVKDGVGYSPLILRGSGVYFSPSGTLVAHVNSTGLALEAGAVFKINSTQVVGARGAAVADATDAASVITQLNALLARCRAHGLIAT